MAWECDEVYLTLEGPAYDKLTPKAIISHLYNVKKKTEWEILGYKIKIDKYGYAKPFKLKGLSFRFYQVDPADVKYRRAIETGKKHIDYPTTVINLVYCGCSYNEFANIRDDIIAYCEAFKYVDTKQYELALIHIKGALEVLPDEHIYSYLYYDIKFLMGEISAIEDEIEFYKNDIDCMTHSGRAQRWISLLFSIDKVDYALSLINRINMLFDELLSGKRTQQRYFKQENHFVEYDKESFNKEVEKIQRKYLKHKREPHRRPTGKASISIIKEDA